jgi:hypothetical protein
MAEVGQGRKEALADTRGRWGESERGRIDYG